MYLLYLFGYIVNGRVFNFFLFFNLFGYCYWYVHILIMLLSTYSQLNLLKFLILEKFKNDLFN